MALVRSPVRRDAREKEVVMEGEPERKKGAQL
jgi:hypothetical protein